MHVYLISYASFLIGPGLTLVQGARLTPACTYLVIRASLSLLAIYVGCRLQNYSSLTSLQSIQHVWPWQQNGDNVPKVNGMFTARVQRTRNCFDVADSSPRNHKNAYIIDNASSQPSLLRSTTIGYFHNLWIVLKICWIFQVYFYDYDHSTK